MTCSNSVANALGLSKQDKTNSTCAADVEQFIIWSANNTVNKITETMTCASQQPMHRDHANKTTPMAYADDTGQIIM